jgi:hypothetical protein
MRWLIILGPDVTNVGRVVEPRNTLWIPSALIAQVLQ